MGHMNSAPYIDPRELPFTRDELFEALRLWVSDVEALEMTAQFAEMANLDMRDRAEDGQHTKATGEDKESDDTNFQWLSPEQLLPSLSVLSDDCAARVDAFMAPYWRRRLERRTRREAISAAERAGRRPTHAEMLEWIARQGSHAGNSPSSESDPANIAIRLPPLPEPTPEDVAAAERFVAEERRKWNGMVEEARERLANQRHGER